LQQFEFIARADRRAERDRDRAYNREADLNGNSHAVT
jgi:hypothetical protein